jgi:hypothetical protein
MRFDELVIEAENSTDGKIVVMPDGREMTEAVVTLSPEGEAMMKQGYLCGNCLQDFAKIGLGAFPEECPVCHFKVRELQGEQLRRQDVGKADLGSRISLSDELTRLGEMQGDEI